MAAPAPPLVTDLLGFGCKTYPRRAQRWPEHLHGHHQFDVTLAGEVAVTFEGRRVLTSNGGHGVLIPPLVRHYHRTPRGFRVCMFFFQVPPHFWPVLGDRPFRVRLSPGVLASVEAMDRARKAGAPLHREEALAVLTRCLVEAVRKGRPAPGGADVPDALRQSLWRLLERIEREPCGPWTVAGLAAECHVTPDHFARRFKSLLDLSPLAFLQQARLRAAARALLADPQLSVKAAAAQSGYATVHAFTRAFSRTIGASPAAFRRTPSEM